MQVFTPSEILEKALHPQKLLRVYARQYGLDEHDSKLLEQLAVGIEEEAEHGGTENERAKIAADHLREDNEYYSKLKAAGLMKSKKPDSLLFLLHQFFFNAEHSSWQYSRLADLEGFPKGLSTENCELIRIDLEHAIAYFACGGDWQQSVCVGISPNKQGKLEVSSLYEDVVPQDRKELTALKSAAKSYTSLEKARKEQYVDKLGRTWKWDGQKYVYQKKNSKTVPHEKKEYEVTNRRNKAGVKDSADQYRNVSGKHFISWDYEPANFEEHKRDAARVGLKTKIVNGELYLEVRGSKAETIRLMHEAMLQAQSEERQVLEKAYKLHYRTTFQGLPICIENRKGSYRRGTDPNGHEWKTFMHCAYGYISQTEGPDGDAVDCYIGPNKESQKVFVVHQANPYAGGLYDEDKVMIGFDSASQAKKAYLKQYDRRDFFQSMDEWNIHDFASHINKKRKFITGVR